MKYKNERNQKDNPVYVLIGSVVFIVFVVLFCVIVWNITHRKDKEIIINSSSVVTTDESSSEVESGFDVVASVESSSEEENSSEGETIEEEGLDYNDASNDMGLTFVPVEDTVTAKDVTNLRSEPSTAQGQATVVTQLRNGETAERIGREDTTGWSKLVYDGKIVYASTNYLLVVEEEEEE